jgi:hypothetical protein
VHGSAMIRLRRPIQPRTAVFVGRFERIVQGRIQLDRGLGLPVPLPRPLYRPVQEEAPETQQQNVGHEVAPVFEKQTRDGRQGYEGERKRMPVQQALVLPLRRCGFGDDWENICIDRRAGKLGARVRTWKVYGG